MTKKKISIIFTSFVWVANSLVGDKIKTCTWFTVVSHSSKAPITKVPVFPDPDCAWAIVSLPFMIGNIPFCWITDGLAFFC